MQVYDFRLALIAALVVGSTVLAQTPFNVTAIAAFNNASRLECWTLPVIPQSGAGAVTYEVGNFTNSFVGVLPPRTYRNATITHAPTVQFTVALSGLIHIMTPYSGLSAEKNEAWVRGGKYGFVIATDLKENSGLGHITEFPSDEPTWLLEFPVPGNAVPDHKLLHTGPCLLQDQIGV